MKLLSFLLLLPVIVLTQSVPFISRIGEVNYIARGISTPRTMLTDPSGNILVIARGSQLVYAFWEDPENSGLFKSLVILDGSNANLGFSHGLAYHDGYLYISSDTTVWRWRYDSSRRTIGNTNDLQVVVSGMSGRGNGGAPLGHYTRTIVFNGNTMYVGISSLENVDADSSRSRIRRFMLPFPPGGVTFDSGELWADGLRNPLALAFDSKNVLWELDNGPDNLIRDDIGPDLTENNPVEELNKLEGPAGQYYGYPRCFSAGNNTAPTLYADPNYLKQYAWPTFMNTTTDEWCQNETNNRKPLMGIIAHSSPIQMRFVSDEDGCEKTSDSIPCSWKGDLLATLHGSWNRKTPAGYAVVRIPFLNGNPQASKIQYLAETQNFQTACNTNAQNNQQNYKCFRPAGITIKDGVIYVSSGITNDIVQLKYDKRRADLAGTGRISLYSSIILGLIHILIVPSSPWIVVSMRAFLVQKFMPALPSILLGVLIGYFLGFAKVDSVWWSHLLVDPSKLMSKVPASSRANAVSFYQAQLDSPYKFDYFLLTCCFILIATFIGQMMKYPLKKWYHLGSLVSFLGAIAVELTFAAPVANKVAKRAGKIIELLHSVAYFHAIVFALLILTAILQTSADVEQEDEIEDRIKLE